MQCFHDEELELEILAYKLSFNYLWAKIDPIYDLNYLIIGLYIVKNCNLISLIILKSK